MNPTNTPQQPIRPTLYIGLGGTGKEVLLRLRRKFYERFRVAVPPCTRFLWIDTDIRDTDARGEVLGTFWNSVAFDDSEKIPLLQGKVGAAAADIFQNQQKWAYLHSWLYEEVERYGRDIADGAGGVRAVGRLMFMANFGNVESALKRAIMSLRETDTLLKTQNFYREHGLGTANMDPNHLPMVCVVSSVAGGTGAGTLLDLTFLLRHLEGTLQKFNGIASYVFLPNVYYQDANTNERAARSYGNAYAALKELDHFCLRIDREGTRAGDGIGIDLDVTWQDRKPLKVMGPPVNVTYLLEMRNTAGVALSPDNRRELFSMVSESLYLDLLPSSFASAKRSDYSNIVQSLAGPAGVNSVAGGVTLPQTFSRRFATCGLSKLEVPQDMIRAACAAQLGSEVVGSYILRDLPELNVAIDARNDRAGAMLDQDGIPALFGTEWKDLLRRAVSDALQGAAWGRAADFGELGRNLEDLERKLTYSSGTDKVRWGDAIKHLREKGGTVLEEAHRRVEALLRERALENPARGAKTALREGGYVDECIAGLEALGAPPEAGIPAVFLQRQTEALGDATTWRRVREGLMQELAEAQNSIVIRALASAEWTLVKLRERLQDAAEQTLFCIAEASLYEQCNRVALSTAKHLEQKKRDIERFLLFAEQYAANSAKRATELQQIESPNQALIFRLYDKAKNWAAYYCLDLEEDGGAQRKVDPAREYARLVAHLEADAGVSGMAALLERGGQGPLAQKIDEFCESRFADDFRLHTRAIDVLEHPLMKERRQEYLQRMVTAALPMLRTNPMLGAMKAEVEHVAYLGVADPQAPKYLELAEEVRLILGSRSGRGYRVEAHATGNPAEVYLYLSDYAFSLPLLPIVEHDAHNAYWDFYERAKRGGAGEAQQLIPLHLSKKWEGKFEDLVVHTDEQASTRREVASILLFGQILKVVGLKDQRGLHSYHYMLGKPFSRAEPLGPRRQVVAHLFQDARLRATLTAAIAQRENSLEPEQALAYHRAAQALANGPELIRGTPEDILLHQKLGVLYSQGGEALREDVDRITNIDQPQRYEYLRKLPDSGLEWALDTYPAVQSLPFWEHPN